MIIEEVSFRLNLKLSLGTIEVYLYQATSYHTTITITPGTISWYAILPRESTVIGAAKW